MELTQMLLTGSLSGLVSVLAHSAAWAMIGLLRKDNERYSAEPPISEALLHMLCGIGLAGLFWLSWGLAALVDERWWLRGLVFGLLCWGTLALPSIASIALSRALGWHHALWIASRWATTALTVGLACAWSWHQAP